MTENVRKWLRTCPLILPQDAFNINYLAGQTVSYSVDTVPGDMILKKYISGDTIRRKAFVVASRQEYGSDVLANISASGFWDEFEKWIENRNRTKNFPQAAEGQRIMSVAVTASSYLYDTGPDSARYQMQIAITYYQKGNR